MSGAASPFSHLLAMTDATKKMQATTYIESRKLLDSRLSKTLAGAYYFALLASIALIAFCVTNPSGLLFKSATIALAALLADMALTVKGNMPLNKIINTWTTADYPDNWHHYRSRCFTFYTIRQAVNLTGFTVLVVGMVFGS